MTDHNQRELDKARPRQGSEADRISSDGDNFSGGPNAKASIEGGFWLAIIALVFSILAIGVSWFMSTIILSQAMLAAERADTAVFATGIGREYIVTTFAETQAELAKYGLSIQGPMGHHRPVSEEVYQQFDAHVAAEIEHLEGEGEQQ